MPLTTVSQGLLSTDAQYTGFKNRLINGDMVIDQRNNGAAVNLITSGGVGYCADRWYSENTTSGTATVQQVADAPTGFSNSIRWTVTGTASSIISSDSAFFQQRIEGFNSADLSFGTANAQTVSISFWVKSSVTGTFGGALANNAYSRGYSFSYTISAANTWEYKTVTITGDTTGTWVGSTNGVGLRLSFAMAAGSARGSTAGSWGSFVGIGASGQINLMATNGATFQITGVQLEKGSVATSFDVLPYTTELALCQRYFEILAPASVMLPWSSNSQIIRISSSFQVTKRTNPTIDMRTKGGGTGTMGAASVSTSGVTYFGSGNLGDVIEYPSPTASIEL